MSPVQEPTPGVVEIRTGVKFNDTHQEDAAVNFPIRGAREAIHRFKNCTGAKNSPYGGRQS